MDCQSLVGSADWCSNKEEIERRASPLEDKTDDPLTWRCRSSSGFLAPGESLKELLLADWKLFVLLELL